MNTKLLDLDDVRRKERRGRVPVGTADALIEQGKRIEFARGKPAYAVDRAWWHERIGANAKRPSRPRQRTHRRVVPPDPGTTLAWLIKLVSFGFIRPCTGCRSRARRLDRLGWRGLFYAALGMLGFVDRRWEAFRR